MYRLSDGHGNLTANKKKYSRCIFMMKFPNIPEINLYEIRVFAL